MGLLFLEEEDEVEIGRVGRCGDADEGNFSGSRRAGIVDGVAHVDELGVGVRGGYAEEAIGRWLLLGDVFHGDDGVEGEVGGEALQGDVGLFARAAGEDGQAKLFGELFEDARTGDPLLAEDESARAIRAQE